MTLSVLYLNNRKLASGERIFSGAQGARGGDAVYLLTSGQFKRVVFSDLLAAGNGFTDGRKGYPQPPA
jgi:hypothetical protein